MESRSNRLIRLCEVLATAFICWTLPVSGDEIVWQGGVSTLWHEGANWEGGIPPGSGDIAVLRSDETAIEVDNDVEGLSVAGIRCEGTAQVTLGGLEITLTGGTDAWLNTVATVCNAPLRFTANPTHFTSTDNGEAEFNGKMTPVGEIEWWYYATLKDASVNLTINGAIDGADATLVIAAEMDTSYGVYLNGPVCLREIISDHQWRSAHLYITSVGNAIGTLSSVGNLAIVLSARNVSLPSTVLSFGHYWGEGETANYRLNADQTMNCVDSCFTGSETKDGVGGNPFDGKYWYSGGVVYESQMENIRGDSNRALLSEPRMLTLKGDHNAATCARLRDNVSVTWDPKGDYTQIFSNRVHETCGGLRVMRGTLKFAGETSLANLTEIVIASGATFWLDTTVADPLSGGRAMVRISAGGHLKIASGANAKVAMLGYDGMRVGAGTYSADGVGGTTQADWISGGGTVTVADIAPSGKSIWIGDTSGNWADEDRWFGGVPRTDTETVIDARGANYTVTVDSDTVMPHNLTLSGPNAQVRVTTAGILSLFNSNEWLDSEVSALTVENGAELRVDGGSVILSNFFGNVVVRGEDDLTGRVSVASGLLYWRTLYAPSYHFCVQEGGRLDVVGGRLETSTDFSPAGTWAPRIRNEGGVVNVSGGQYLTRAPQDYYTAFCTGHSIFSQNGRLGFQDVAQGRGCLWIRPTASGETAELRFEGNASVDVSDYPSRQISLYNGGLAGGVSRLVFAGAGDYSNADDELGLAFYMFVGCREGYGEMDIRSGCVRAGACGLYVGTSAMEQTHVPSAGVEGVVRMNGGRLLVQGNNSTGYGDALLYGLTVGDGVYNAVTLGRPYHGRMEIRAGAVTNKDSNTVIGFGHATGAVTQDGGLFETCNGSTSVVLGMMGGEGLFTVSNGETRIAGSLYIGGAQTNVFAMGGAWGTKYGYPADDHTATGCLSFAGGTLRVAGSATLGSDGSGTLERIGTNGTICITGNIVMTNVAENADSCGTLKFTFDKKGGIAPIETSSALYTSANSKLIIDIGEYDGDTRYFPILKTGWIPVDQMFRPENIIITGAPGNRRIEKARVSRTPGDNETLRVVLPFVGRGSVIVVR